MTHEELSNSPPELAVLDSAEVFVLVDNVSDGLSSVPEGVTNEMDNITEACGPHFSGEHLCFACFGISLVLTARLGDSTRTVLFDGGPNGTAVEHNVPLLGIDMGAIEAAVLSHGHTDHAGGLPAAIRLVTQANGGKAVPVHVNEDMFRRRGEKLSEDEFLLHDNIPSPEELAAANAAVLAARSASESACMLSSSALMRCRGSPPANWTSTGETS